jgi:hypothetical protein
LRRASQERRRTLRVWRKWLALYGSPPGGPPSGADFEPGRLRKTRRIGGCLHERCYLCHPSKLIGYPTPQEELAWLKEREQLADLALLQLARRQRLRHRARFGHLGRAVMQVARKTGSTGAPQAETMEQ